MLADVVRNPRRTLSTVIGVALGVGLFCGVLFFVDGLSASMTQRAVAPLPIDMQRVVTAPVGSGLSLMQMFDRADLATGEQAHVELLIENTGEVAAHEVTIRSVLSDSVLYVSGSAFIDEEPLPGATENPLASGPARAGLNLGTIDVGHSHRLRFLIEARTPTQLDDTIVRSTQSSREVVAPSAANEPTSIQLSQLASMIGAVDGVASAQQLSLGDLAPSSISYQGAHAAGPTKVFGFDASGIDTSGAVNGAIILDGGHAPDMALISVESAASLAVEVGDTVSVALPDESSFEVVISGVVDLSRAIPLFSSRRGGDLETFIYAPNSIVLSSETFAAVVMPAFERAVAEGNSRLKNPPLREVDVILDRQRLDADPATALVETRQVAEAIESVAGREGYLLDNISNTLDVASADATTAKRLFVVLGVPGGILAAVLAAYAGAVLAEGQRRENATLRIRGASRLHLLRMVALRAGLLAAAGSTIGLALGYGATWLILGQESLSRANPTSLVVSGGLGTVVGFVATAAALYTTGRRSIDREINDDRSHMTDRRPVWHRARLDAFGLLVLVIATAAALRSDAFAGASGSVYFGRAVELNLALLILPISLWITGSLVMARLLGKILTGSKPASTSAIAHPMRGVFHRSVSRRPWAISNATIALSLIVALATSLGGFTSSYDAAKLQDARYATGSDVRITPSPTAATRFDIDDTSLFEVENATATPVIFSVSNVILRSARTSDPANLAAIDPSSFERVAPVGDGDFLSGSAPAVMAMLDRDPDALVMSRTMADLLQADVGDRVHVLLARATGDQVEVELRIAALFERLPGFPEGADAMMAIDRHIGAVPSKHADFFLAAASTGGDAELDRLIEALRLGPGSGGDLQISDRRQTLARDQSSLAALNIAGLVDLDTTFAFLMAAVSLSIFVFGLLLQRRREYVTLRAQGVEARALRLLVGAEAATVGLGGLFAGVVVGVAMGYYFVAVLRPLFVLAPAYSVSWSTIGIVCALVGGATLLSSIAAADLIRRLEPTELLRDD